MPHGDDVPGHGAVKAAGKWATAQSHHVLPKTAQPVRQAVSISLQIVSGRVMLVVLSVLTCSY